LLKAVKKTTKISEMLTKNKDVNYAEDTSAGDYFFKVSAEIKQLTEADDYSDIMNKFMKEEMREYKRATSSNALKFENMISKYAVTKFAEDKKKRLKDSHQLRKLIEKICPPS